MRGFSSLASHAAVAVTLIGALMAGADTLGAQSAGVIAPPPRRVAPPVVARGLSDSARAALGARRDSLTLRQRLDIVAWVDSAAGALAAGAPATTVPLTAPPPAPARPDTTRRVPNRVPNTPRRPRVDTDVVGAARPVARVGTEWYLRRCECLGTAHPT